MLRCHLVSPGHRLEKALWFGIHDDAFTVHDNTRDAVGVVAVENGIEVGSVVGKRTPSTFKSHGSYVLRSHRKRGLAMRMWVKLIRDLKPKAVEIVTVSDRGYTLAQSLMESFPGIRFSTCEDGGRKLRDLRQRNARRS